MKLSNFYKDNQLLLGIKTDQGLIDVKTQAKKHGLEVPTTMEEVISGGEEATAKLKKLTAAADEYVNEEAITFSPVVTNPEKIICVGLNYEKHAHETNQAIPERPILFSKFNNALAGHQEAIPVPKTDHRIDYEAELVIVMGKEAANISTEDALSYVFGYTIGNDVSARKLQSISGQWLLGKTADKFAPVGPYIVTADEIDPDNLEIGCEINGETRQASNTNDMIFNCSEIVSYISKHITLKPGDIIFTGTPEGVIVGHPRGDRVWLKSGDEMKVSIEQIGELVNVLE